MKELVLKSGKQLALALKMANAYYNITDFPVQLRETDKGKLNYVVLLDLDDETFARFKESFQTMTL